jgi:prevent-host-death family protein
MVVVKLINSIYKIANLAIIEFMKSSPRAVPATEIKNRFGDYLGEVVHRREPLVIERHGKPVAVLVGIEEWRRLQDEEGKRSTVPWVEACMKLAEEIRKKHPRARHTSAVDLVKAVREEEE